jgi:predicted enzyme related to lactoylglutathione lyase
MDRSIEIMIAPDGGLTINAVNFKGADCDQATKFLEQVLGVATEKRRKPEYHQSARRKNQQTLGT